MSDHSLESFIKTVLINQLKVMAFTGETQYLSFGNVAMGIEFLGACTDDKPFNQTGLSGARFKAGIETYMKQVNPLYSNYNDPAKPYNLYKNLRCGMAHIIRPQGNIGLIGKAGAKHAGRTHLDLLNNQTILLTAEDFYDDFAEACQLLLADLPSKMGAKFTDIYLPVSNLPTNSTSTISTTSSLDTTNTGLSGQP